MNKPFMRGEDYKWQVDPSNPNRIRGAGLKNLKSFLDSRRNGSSGGQEYRFASNAPIGKAVPGIAHYHVTQDLSLVYRTEGNTTYLFGIYSHADLGTGTPPKIKTQQSAATRFSNMSFSE
jgi:hypothetical protein